MLKTLRSMPNCKMITKRAINQISKEIGIHKKLYQPIFQTYANFEDNLRTKNIEKSDLLEIVSNLIINENTDFGNLALKYPEECLKVKNSADKYLENEFEIFDKTYSFPKNINWHITENDKSWPNEHFSKIKLDPKKLGDIKYTWELNRLGSLQILSVAYRLENKKEYLVKAEEIINSNIDSNPPEIGVNWINDQELSYRMISLLISLQLLGEELSDITVNKCFWFFLEAGRHINQEINFTYSCIKNNHIIGASVGLILSAILTSNFNDVFDEWLTKGMKYFNRSVKELFYEDGSYKNLSINYQIVSSLFILIGIKAFNNVGQEIETLEELLLKSARTLKTLSCKKVVPQIGAWDSGRPLQLSLYEETDISEIVNAVEVFSLRGRPKKLLGEFFKNEESKKDYTLAPSKDSAYVLLNGLSRIKKGNSVIYFLGGDHPLYSQRHADYLGFLWFNDGYEIIGDSGNYKYNVENIKWNHYFRSSYAHNCLIINEKPFSEPFNAFRWLSYPKTTVDLKNKQSISGEISSKNYEHHRKIQLESEQVIRIDDLIEIKGNNLKQRKASLWFHFPLGKRIEKTNSDIRIILKNNKTLNMRCNKNYYLSFFEGSSKPIAGWKSDYYGEKHPILCLCLDFSFTEKHYEIITELKLGESN